MKKQIKEIITEKWSNIRIQRKNKDKLMQLKGKYSCLLYDEVLEILFNIEDIFKINQSTKSQEVKK